MGGRALKWLVSAAEIYWQMSFYSQGCEINKSSWEDRERWSMPTGQLKEQLNAMQKSSFKKRCSDLISLSM